MTRGRRPWRFAAALRMPRGMWLLLCAVLGSGLVALGAWAYARERHDLPPFDPAKVAQLSPQRRAEYERLLFNELIVWNAGSRRHDLWGREAEWLAMATDGYELAYITLQVLSPTKGEFALDKPMARLIELAEQGDSGAMCLMWRLANLAEGLSGWERYRQPGLAFTKRGAELGHPACLMLLGALLMQGTEGPQDVDAAYGMLVRAELAGYDGAAGALARHFRLKGIGSAADVERWLCWEVVGAKYVYFANRWDFGTGDLEKAAISAGRQDLVDLARRYRAMKPDELDVNRCIALKLGD